MSNGVTCAAQEARLLARQFAAAHVTSATLIGLQVTIYSTPVRPLSQPRTYIGLRTFHAAHTLIMTDDASPAAAAAARDVSDDVSSVTSSSPSRRALDFSISSLLGSRRAPAGRGGACTERACDASHYSSTAVGDSSPVLLRQRLAAAAAALWYPWLHGVAASVTVQSPASKHRLDNGKYVRRVVVISSTAFYRAMLCIRGTSHGSVSVCVCLCLCLSQVGVLLKRLNLGSHKQHHTIVQGL